ncbi:hypothetical protein [Roseibium sp. RKSG952]|uniref:hypothetical protein n=1 Tax=Roseibium sp. RKSG952 TaxID=2529384 RepID=UPI0012BCF080|nr:hypothetical protein [Roseibium sp. RKSG952]MTH96370.1 hypothetical protein [Roseibium sp. RKSG952]
MIHDLTRTILRHPASALAAAWQALRGLPATRTWIWLVGPLPHETAPAFCLVLFQSLSVFLDATFGWAIHHD